MILLQAVLLLGFGAGSFAAWSPKGMLRAAVLHRFAPALIGGQAGLLWLLFTDGSPGGLNVTVPAFALAVLVASWAQNLAQPVYSTYKITFPLCFAGLLAPLAFRAHESSAAEWSVALGLHLALAVLAYALVVLAFILMVVRGFEMEQLSDGLDEEKRVPLLTIERLSVVHIYAGFAALTLTLASGAYLSLHDAPGVLEFSHKNLFAVLTWVTLVIFIAGHRIRGWRGKTALAYMGAGMVLLLLSYFGTSFVLQMILGR